MCVVEKKTYLRGDGHREEVEITRRCHRATGSRLCDRVEQHGAGQASKVDRKAGASRGSGDGYLVTEGQDGRERIYRDVTRRSSKRASISIRRSGTTTDRPSMGSPSSASSPSTYSYVEVRPSAPSPTPAAAGIPGLERERRPWSGATDSDRVITQDGAAIYDRPPPLDMPRSRDNERRTRFVSPERDRQSSISSTMTDLDEPEVVEPPRRRPSIKVNTSARPPMRSSPTTSSPGLSQLPRVSHLRNDSAREIPDYRPQYDSRDSRGRRQESMDDRQAQLERERLAETERRQEARNVEYAARETSRERREHHRRKTAAALEGERRAVSREEARRSAEHAALEASRERRELHRRETAAALEGERRAVSRQEQLEAELAQMERERAAAEQRKRDAEAATRRAEEEEWRGAEPRPRYYETRTSTSPRVSRRMTGEDGSYSPYAGPSSLPARSAMPGSGGGVTVHQHQYPPGRRESTISARGAKVIAREQARAGMEERAQRASRPLSGAMGSLHIGDDRDGAGLMEDEMDEVYYLEEGLRTQESRRMRRDADRAGRKREFWDRYP